jgi:membrane fusion protein, multidrug efflux system
VYRRLFATAVLSMIAAPAFAQGGPPAMPVTVAEPLAKRVTQWDEYSGRFEPTASVEVRARVSGFIDKLHFRDGQLVKVGDLLFTIDKRPFDIAVESAKAEVARNQAQVNLAELQVERGASLSKSRTITDQEYDQRKANLKVAQAQLNTAEAGLKGTSNNGVVDRCMRVIGLT